MLLKHIAEITPHTRLLRTVLLMLCATIAISGCGSDSTAPPASTPAPSPTPSAAPVPTAGVAVVAPLTATPLPAPTSIPPSPAPVEPSPILPTEPPVPTALVAVAPTEEIFPSPVPPTSIPPSPAPPAPTEDVAAAPAPEPPVGLRYVFPVQSSGKISYGKYHHDYPATDIFCPVGSAFVAPTSGVVDWISAEDAWDPTTDNPALRGGRSVAIIGDDGARYYGSHLSAIAEGLTVGQRVDTGQLLGLTGNSGDARSTPPHLHFGISHPTTPDDWQVRRGEISPFPYLNAWRNGEMIRPEL